jgi:hypothetical protein
VRFVWQGLRLVQEIDPDYVRSYVYSPDAAYTPLARLDVTNIAEVPPDFRTLAMLRPRVLHFHTNRPGKPDLRAQPVLRFYTRAAPPARLICQSRLGAGNGMLRRAGPQAVAVGG